MADRVESVLFRDPAIPNGAVSVNVEHGVVVLRGEVRDEHQQWSLERTAWRIPGVWSVENRLRVGRPSRVQDRQLATARTG